MSESEVAFSVEEIAGFRDDLSNEEYHRTVGVSSSVLKNVLHSTEYAKYEMDNPSDPTPLMEFGTAAHAAILEPDLFSALYVKGPEGLDRRTKAGKETWENFLSENVGRKVLKADDFDALLAIQKKAHAHPRFQELIEGGVCEQSGFFVDPATGLLCKIRPDLRNERLRVVLDVKTSEDATFFAFQRTVAAQKYHVSAPFYLEGVHLLTGEVYTYEWMAVERSAPYGIKFYRASGPLLEKGEQDLRRALELYKACQESGDWSDPDVEPKDMFLPHWAFAES